MQLKVKVLQIQYNTPSDYSDTEGFYNVMLQSFYKEGEANVKVMLTQNSQPDWKVGDEVEITV